MTALTRAAAIIVLTSISVAGQTIRIDNVPTGLRPLGLDTTSFTDSAGNRVAYAVVANSGNDSVSIFRLESGTGGKSIRLVSTIQGVPGPYAVASCRDSVAFGIGDRLLVSSPSDNSIKVIQVPQGTVLASIPVGSAPYSIGCIKTDKTLAVASNAGDNSLTVLDVDSLSVLSRIVDVPAARGLHGIAVYRNEQGGYVAWVGGTDANVVTLVDLGAGRVVTRIPVARPTAVFAARYGCCFVASTQNNSVTVYNPETLQVIASLTDVPNPQDFVFSGLGDFATIGRRDAVWRLTPGGTARVPESVDTIIPNIPGAAGLALYSSTTNLLPGTSWVLGTSADSNSVFLIQQQPASPHDFDTFSAAFRTTQTATNSLASAFTTTGVSQNFSANSLPLPRTLGGVTLSVGGTLSLDVSSGWKYSPTGSIQAPLVFVGPSQINFQIPPGIAPGPDVPAQLTKTDGSTLLTTLNITATAPGIFSLLQNGQGQGAVLNGDFSQNGIPQLIVGAKPAALGSVIQIFATGAGETDPPLLPGEAAPISGNPLFLTRVQPTVTIGGIQAKVQFSGMAPGWVGLWQINAEVPQNVPPGSAVPLTITADSQTSNTVTIAVE